MLELESGGHRIQRVPPTEKKGRVHTSTVTVAVLPHASETVKQTKVMTKDVNTDWFSGTGKGGQKRNKAQACCRLTHIPTGITVIQQGRSRKNNYKLAFDELEKRVQEINEEADRKQENSLRQMQINSGGRDQKTVTIRMQDDIVIHHITNKRTTAKRYMNGHIGDLY